jgi:hypothetical protein
MAGEAVHNSPKRRCHVVSAAHVRRFPRGDPNGDHLHNRVEHPDIFLAVASEEVAHNTGTAPNPDRLSISYGNSLPEWLGRGRVDEMGCCPACCADDHRRPDREDSEDVEIGRSKRALVT